LTAYFLTIASGGVLGGAFVGICAPYFFKGAFEIHVSLILCALLVVLRLFKDPPVKRSVWAHVTFGAGAAFTAALLGFLVLAMRNDAADCIMRERNFYGMLRVREETADNKETYRSLVHGTIEHGEQWLGNDLKHEPTTYYCRETGVGQVLMHELSGTSRHVGLIGLGIGTLAAYGRPGDTFRFYELNPMVVVVAQQWFSYLSETRAHIEIALGDGRLSLEHEPPQNFDLLALDAFSGDSIPVHLLTREAFALYFRHLKPQGILAVHVSNRYVDLAPMVACVARSVGKTATVVESEGDDDEICYDADWVLVPADGRELKLQGAHQSEAWNGLRAWTDDYSNVFSLLKFRKDR